MNTLCAWEKKEGRFGILLKNWVKIYWPVSLKLGNTQQTKVTFHILIMEDALKDISGLVSFQNKNIIKYFRKKYFQVFDWLRDLLQDGG